MKPRSGLIRRARAGDAGPLLSWRTAPWESITPTDIPKTPSAQTLVLMAQVRALGAGHWPLVHLTPSILPTLGLGEHVALVLECEDQPLNATPRLIEHAKATHPNASVVVIPHRPDCRHRHGPEQLKSLGNAVWQLPDVINLFDWAAHALGVFTWAADTGFDALLAGLSVSTLGNPFYAGWGLTHDLEAAGPLKGNASLPSLFEATVVKRSAYADVSRNGHAELSDLLSCVALQREVNERHGDLGPILALGMSRWKRPFIRPFLEAGGHRIRWSRLTSPVWRTSDEGGALALWGAGQVSKDMTSRPIIRVEDGFLRSAGLGSDLIAPRSLVLDRKGIYFDARGGSDLIDALNHHDVAPPSRARARALQAQLISSGITKYNFVRRRPTWTPPSNKRVILVAGQVADDASIALGCGSQPHHVRTAEQLLAAVRARHPLDFVVYKPHPDVLSGNRRGLIHAQSYCDRVDAQSDLLSLIEMADEVHVISSLAGLDALIRNRKVVTHGMPFYAGWGLTTDLCDELKPRLRSREIDELLAICLLRYPLYWDWEWRVFTTAEATIRQLCFDREHATLPSEWQRFARSIHKTKTWLNNLLRG